MSERSSSQVARLIALFAGLAVLVTVSSPRPWSVVAGGILVVAGEATRLWAAGHLVKTTELVTSGPYAFTRNPMYLGRLLILSGVSVIAWLPGGANLLLLGLAWAAFFGVYMRRKERVEPARLARRHGERYAAYHAAVPSIFPRFRRWPHAERRRWNARRFHENRELWTAVGLALLVAGLAYRAGTAGL